MSPTAAYPDGMCRFLAIRIIDDFNSEDFSTFGGGRAHTELREAQTTGKKVFQVGMRPSKARQQAPGQRPRGWLETGASASSREDRGQVTAFFAEGDVNLLFLDNALAEPPCGWRP